MGLIDLTTDLKSLNNKQTGARPLLVSKDINDPPNTGGLAMQVNHRIDDLVRHTKLLVRKPGLKFLGNQALLAQTDMKKFVKNQQGKSAKAIAKAVGKKAKDTLENTALATASILGQIPVNGTGTHFVRGFKKADDTYLNLHGMKLSSFHAPDGSIIPNGTPKDGLKSFIIKDDSYQISGLGKTTDNKYNSGEKWVAASGTIQRTESKEYIATEGSPTGIVKGGNKITALDNPGVSPGQEAVKEGSVLKEKESTSEITVNRLGKPAETFKQRPEEIEDGDTYLQKKYGKETTSITVKANDEARSKREEGLEDKADPVLAAATTATILGTDAEDIIPFEFNTFYPGNTDGKFLAFRAFLTDFSDNFSGDWAGTKYVGRGEELYNYQGFKRDISFSFKVAAFSKADMQPLYEKLNLLAGSTAPTYRNGNFMMGTLTKVTIGDYLVQTSGFISSVGLSWDSNIPWEMETEGERLPHALDVSIAFTPIHDFIPTANSTFIG